MTEPATYEELGRALADMIDTLDSQRKFAGDLEGVFTVPLSDGAEYIVTVLRKTEEEMGDD